MLERLEFHSPVAGRQNVRESVGAQEVMLSVQALEVWASIAHAQKRRNRGVPQSIMRFA